MSNETLTDLIYYQVLYALFTYELISIIASELIENTFKFFKKDTNKNE